MLKRLRKLRNRLYEKFMRFMMRIGPRPEPRVNDKPFTVLWNPASAQFCPYCDWVYMVWHVEGHCWICPDCRLECDPPLAVTEKRAAVRVIEVAVPKPTVPLRRTGDLARAYHEHKDIIPVPVGDRLICRLGTKDGRTITTEELKAYPNVRRTG